MLTRRRRSNLRRHPRPSPVLARLDRNGISGAFGWMYVAISSGSAWKPPLANSATEPAAEGLPGVPRLDPDDLAGLDDERVHLGRVSTDPPATTTADRQASRYSLMSTWRPRP